jgi:two-component system cell cycle sensor histidine kinase/response regulator CckA
MEANSISGIALQGLTKVDTDERCLVVSQAYARTFGHAPDELVGSDWKSVLQPEEIERAVHSYEEMLATGIGELQVADLSESKAPSLKRMLLVKSYDRENAFCGHFSFVQDPVYTQQKELALRQAEEVFRVAFEDAPVGGVLIDSEAGFRRTNRALCDMLGYSGQELNGKGFGDITSPQDFENSLILPWLVLKGTLSGYWLERRLFRRKGETFWVNLTVRVIRSLDGKPMYAIGMIRDLSVRSQLRTVPEPTTVAALEQTENSLRESEQRYYAVAEQSWEGIFLFNPVSKKIVEATRSFLQLIGRNRGEILQLTLYDLIARERETIDNDIGLILTNQHCTIGELPFRRKDGSVVDMEVSASVVYFSGTLVLRAVVRDVFEQRHLEEQLRHGVKMEALGRLAGGVAHDFNNLLVGILGYSSLLKDRLKDTDPLSRMAREIYDVALRARDLTAQLLSFSRGQVLPTQVLELNTVVRRTEELLRRILGEDIELVCHLDSFLGQVKANPGQMEQVIVNLAANARDAMPSGGTLTIKTTNFRVDQSVASWLPDLIPGDYVLLSVSDTGCGMESVTLAHIFEPFYTTKSGVGTGLGLSTVYGIIKQSGGYIAAYSHPGAGATFDIYLPRVNEQGYLFHLKGELAEEAESFPPTATILVVEDEAIVRSLVGEALENRGYRILYAREGEEALALARTYQGLIHLVVTDIVMPGMTGPTLAVEFVKLKPNTRVLYMSGYPDREITTVGRLEDKAFFLQKPFTPEELYRRVREILNVKRVTES